MASADCDSVSESESEAEAESKMTNDQMSHMEFKVAAAVRRLEWNF